MIVTKKFLFLFVFKSIIVEKEASNCNFIGLGANLKIPREIDSSRKVKRDYIKITKLFFLPPANKNDLGLLSLH